MLTEFWEGNKMKCASDFGDGLRVVAEHLFSPLPADSDQVCG